MKRSSSLPTSACRRCFFVFASLLFAVACSLLVTGCFGLFKPDAVETRRFLLTPTCESATNTNTPPVALGLGQVKLPAYLKGASIVMRQGSNEIAYLPRALWSERLDAGVQRVLAANLAALLPADPVRQSAWSQDEVAVGVYVTIEQFEMQASGGAVLVASWRVVSPGGARLLKSGRCRIANGGAHSPGDAAAAVAGMSALLDDFSRQLAQSIRDAVQTTKESKESGGHKFT
ncbi:MAG TPA: PqiC family protein [Verrucomicrobiae bacterium]